VYAATSGDRIYALDAVTGAIVWQRSAGTPVPAGSLPCGNITPTVGIKSYNNILGGETVADFVARKFRDPLGLEGTALTDADGNVGILIRTLPRRIIDRGMPKFLLIGQSPFSFLRFAILLFSSPSLQFF